MSVRTESGSDRIKVQRLKLSDDPVATALGSDTTYFAAWHFPQPFGSDPEIFVANSGFALIAAS